MTAWDLLRDTREWLTYVVGAPSGTEDLLGRIEAFLAAPAPMTLAEMATALDQPIDLKFFTGTRSDPPGHVPTPTGQRWRATIAHHYYTTDTLRLVGTEDLGHARAGWGNTPEEALINLYDRAVQELANSVASRLDGVAQVRDELAAAEVLLARLRGGR